MDAEKLRDIYNDRFQKNLDNWSSSDIRKTFTVAKRTLRWLRRLGMDGQGLKVLDVGCATGYYTEAFRLLGCEATGLDYSEVGLQRAKEKFPKCTFVQMNGFEPILANTFDVIFCRGFSGANTHDLNFIASWVDKYFPYLNKNGFFVLSASTNFTGVEREGEMVNLSWDELKKLSSLVKGKYRGTFLFYYLGLISKIKRNFEKIVLRKKVKDYYYTFFQNI
jgi:SAM-dependent methyltransferase